MSRKPLYIVHCTLYIVHRTVYIIASLMKQKITFVICLLFGLLFINSGLNKFFNYLPVPPDLPAKMAAMNAAITQIGWLLPLVGFVEVLGGLLFIIPRYRALGAIMLFPIMVGIVLVHVTAAPSGLAFALVLLAILLWVIYDNRARYVPMIQA
jgi:putative oxidoreductase